MEPPEDFWSSLWSLLCFLPYFICLFILGNIKGILGLILMYYLELSIVCLDYFFVSFFHALSSSSNGIEYVLHEEYVHGYKLRLRLQLHFEPLYCDKM
jgi:hypothetical protein